MYFIVNINFFNGSNDLSNFLKCANFILNVISTGMNDDHIRFLGSNRSDVVYNIIRMAPGWHLILTESSLETSRPFTCLFCFFDVEFITPRFSLLFEFLFSLNLTWRLLLSTGLYFLSLGDMLPLTGPLWLPW